MLSQVQVTEGRRMSLLMKLGFLWLVTLGFIAAVFFGAAVAIGAPPGGYGGPTLLRQPLFGAAWVPPTADAPAAAAAGDPDVKRLEDKIDRLAEQVGRLLKALEEDAPAADRVAAPAEKDDAAFQAGMNACLKCHGEAVAKAKGEGFRLFKALPKLPDGREAVAVRDDLEVRDVRHVLERVGNGSMPRGTKLTDVQKKAILDHFKARLPQEPPGE